MSQKRYRYTGKEKDEETGLYYHGARYYMPWLGRWERADPIGLGDGLNRWAYVRGNPVGLHDPTGNGTESSIESLVQGFRTFSAQLASAASEPTLQTPMGAMPVSDVAAFAHERASASIGLLAAEYPRVMGALKAVGGAFEVGVGAMAVAAPEPISKAFGVAAFTHGVDTLAAGLIQMETGQATQTIFSLGVESFAVAGGADPATAHSKAETLDAIYAGLLPLGAGALAARAPGAIGAASALDDTAGMIGGSLRRGVNLDTGTASAFVSEGSPMRHALRGEVQGRTMLMTQTAASEFQGMLHVAGPLERARAARLMERITLIPDDPSARAMGLRVTKTGPPVSSGDDGAPIE